MDDRRSFDSMTVLAEAPVAVELAGGLTDLLSAGAGTESTVVAGTLDTWVRAEAIAGGGRIVLHAEDALERVSLESAAEVRYDGRLVRHKAAVNMLPVPGGLQLITRSSPEHAGLPGVDAALDVALLGALAALRLESLSSEELGDLACDLHRRELASAGGCAERMAASRGGLVHLRSHAGDADITSIPLADSIREAFILVVPPGLAGEAGVVRAAWHAARAGDPLAGRAAAVSEHAAKLMVESLSRGDTETVAHALDLVWSAQCMLAGRAMPEQMVSLVRTLKEAGAVAARAAGWICSAGLLVLPGPGASAHASVLQAAISGGATATLLRLGGAGATVSASDALSQRPQ